MCAMDPEDIWSCIYGRLVLLRYVYNMTAHLFVVLTVIMVAADVAYAESPDATVVKVSGRALVRQRPDMPPQRLHEGDRLFAGQEISCAQGCNELVISVCNLRVPVYRSKRILSIGCGVPEGTRSGPNRAAIGAVAYPMAAQVVQPERFYVQWKPHATSIRLTLRKYLGKVYWGPQSVDGNRGVYESNSLKALLKRVQKEDSIHLELIFEDGRGAPEDIRFDLISIDDQVRLNKQLEALESESNRVLKAIGRGTAFSNYEMYVEGAKEFEKALAMPEPRTLASTNLAVLTRLAILADYKAYRDQRVKELCKSSKVATASVPCACLNSCQ
jgi:hypothetical protein